MNQSIQRITETNVIEVRQRLRSERHRHHRHRHAPSKMHQKIATFQRKRNSDVKFIISYLLS